MTAALVTIAFLSTLWMLAVISAHVLETSGAKIVAALQGRSVEPTLATRPVRIRYARYQPERRAPVSVRQRAAA